MAESLRGLHEPAGFTQPLAKGRHDVTTVGASEATIDFQTKAKYVLAGALLALLTGGILIMAAYALDWWGLDDRPPIIVKMVMKIPLATMASG